MMEVRRVSLGEEVLSVAVRSGSPTVLLLHGLAGHSSEWARLIDCLGPEIGIISPDQRAHGASWALGTKSIGRESYLSDAIALVEQLAAEPVMVVGQSMGGIVATLVAHARPDLVTRLVLVEAGMAAFTDSGLAGLEAWFAAWPEIFKDEAEARDFFGVDAPSTPARVDGLEVGPRGLSRRFDAEAMIETMRELAFDNRWPEWSELEVPTTLIRASESFLSDDEVARMLEVRPKTEVVVVDDSGHDVHLDQPGRVAEVLRAHIEG